MTRAEWKRRHVEWKRHRKAIWESMNGCNCPVSFKSGGKVVVLKRDERCERNVVRCHGRMNVIFKRQEKLGAEPDKTGEKNEARSGE